MFTIKRSVILFIILIVFTSCDQPKREKQSVDQASLKEAKFQIKTYQSDSGGYGYDVFVNATRMIHQPNIPGQELRDSI